MSSKSKKLAVAAGLTTIVGAVTAYSRKKRWEEVHTATVIAGAVIMIIGALD